MIHQVMPQFTAAATQPIGPDIGSGVHQYPGTVQRRSIQKHDLGFVLDRLIRLRIQHLYAGCPLLVLVIEGLRDDGPGAYREITSRNRRWQGRRLSREIAAEWTA